MQANDNIFKQLRRKWDSMNSEENRMVKTAYLDNPHHIYDDCLFPTKLVMGVAIAVTLAFGGYYHYHIFTQAFGLGVVAVLGSLLWFIVIEITKVYFGMRVARSFSCGAWMQSWPKLLFTLALVGIVAFAFHISIGISTKSVATVNQLLRTERLFTGSQFTPPPSIATIDQQIAAAEKVSIKAQKSTWSGKPTKEGLDNMKQAETTKQLLLKQRETAMAQARADHDRKLGLSNQQIVQSATQLATYGGITEYGTLALILLLALLERISKENNKGMPEATEAATVSADMSLAKQVADRPVVGFEAIRNRAASAPPPPTVSLPTGTAEQLVAQAVPAKQPTETIRETIIVSAPEQDVAKWRKYAKTYYDRSRKPSSAETTRQNNWNTYLEYKELLETAGITLEEGETVTFKTTAQP